MEGKDKKTICIVAPGYISSNPRVVKEADALWQAGFNIRVIFSQGNLERVRLFDEILLKEKSWKWEAVYWSPFRKKERPLYYKSKFRYHLVRRLPLSLLSFGKLTEYSEGRVYKELAELAASEKADLYIGHYPTGLAAAAYAAFQWGAKLCYDVEDLHTGEPLPVKQKERIKIIESRYLTRCSYVSAVSELVADEMVNRYGIIRPIVIHNVFPWADRKKLDGQIIDRKESTLSLYWYSQVIGEDRGIQDAIKAAGLLKEKVQIHLRGSVSKEVKNKFLTLARECEVGENLYFHPPVSPTELLSRAVEHDVGLALEQLNSLNHKLTVTNKFFFYLLAGLAIVATDIPGQRYIMSTCPDAGFLYPPGDYQTLAGYIKLWIENRERLESCKRTALEAARNRWNWEIESKKLVDTVGDLLRV